MQVTEEDEEESDEVIVLLEERLQELEAGKIKSIPWEEARERIIENLKKRRTAGEG